MADWYTNGVGINWGNIPNPFSGFQEWAQNRSTPSMMDQGYTKTLFDGGLNGGSVTGKFPSRVYGGNSYMNKTNVTNPDGQLNLTNLLVLGIGAFVIIKMMD